MRGKKWGKNCDKNCKFMQNTFHCLSAGEGLNKAKVILTSSRDVALVQSHSRVSLDFRSWSRYLSSSHLAAMSHLICCKAKVAFSLTSGLEPVSFIFTSSRGVTNLVQSQSCVFLLPKLEPLSFVFASSRDVTLYLLNSKVAFFLLRESRL